MPQPRDTYLYMPLRPTEEGTPLVPGEVAITLDAQTDSDKLLDTLADFGHSEYEIMQDLAVVMRYGTEVLGLMDGVLLEVEHRPTWQSRIELAVQFERPSYDDVRESLRYIGLADETPAILGAIAVEFINRGELIGSTLIARQYHTPEFAEARSVVARALEKLRFKDKKELFWDYTKQPSRAALRLVHSSDDTEVSPEPEVDTPIQLVLPGATRRPRASGAGAP